MFTFLPQITLCNININKKCLRGFAMFAICIYVLLCMDCGVLKKKMNEERATCRDAYGSFVIIMMMIIVFSTILHARVPKWVGRVTRKGITSNI